MKESIWVVNLDKINLLELENFFKNKEVSFVVFLTGKNCPLTPELLINQGKCCGNGCFFCPYFPKSIKNNREIKLASFLKKIKVLTANKDDLSLFKSIYCLDTCKEYNI